MKRVLYLAMAALMVLAVSCKKDPKVRVPSVKTLEATDIQATGATLHAWIDFAGTNWGGVNYGFYWGTSEDALDTYIQADELFDEENAYFAGLSGLAPETQYWYKAFIEIDDKSFSGEILNFTTEKDPVPDGSVDLGIVMTRDDGTTYKLYWATSNLSEDGLCPHPEDFGDYFAWGETVPHYLKGHSQDSPCNDWRITDGLWEYDWPYYKWNGGDPYKIIKYCPEDQSSLWAGVGTPDGKMVLDGGPDGDDAASKILGGKWRMPTIEEWTELMGKCEWSWTDNYNGTGVIGRIVTSNIEGFKDRSIFLPCAGLRQGNALKYKEDSGYYWSSSVDTEDSCYGVCVAFYPDKVSYGGNRRENGQSIRPVYED